MYIGQLIVNTLNAMPMKGYRVYIINVVALFGALVYAALTHGNTEYAIGVAFMALHNIYKNLHFDNTATRYIAIESLLNDLVDAKNDK